MLLFADVHFEVFFADMLADNHAFVNFDARATEKLAALLRSVQTEGGGDARLPGDERAQIARGDRSGQRAVAAEDGVHDALAARIGQELLAEAEQPARGHAADEMDTAVVAIFHILGD